MDDHRFDDLTKRLATGASRRQVLKALAASALGGFTAAVRGSESEARRPCATTADCSKDPVASQVCIGGECCGKARRCNNDTICCPQGQYCTEQGCCPRNEVCHDAGKNYCCGPCHTCEGGVCAPCGRCQDCVGSRCKDNKKKCVSCRGGGGGPAAASSDATATKVVECGPCETCDPDQGCVPKSCDACSPCDPASGQCTAKTCPTCEQCDAATGSCAPMTCGACEECSDGECTPKLVPLCGGCEEPVCDGNSQEYVCGPRCALGQVCCGDDCRPACANGCTRNETSCACDAVSPGQVYCATSDECAANSCTGNQFFNIATCECQCSTEPCAEGETRNPQSCACEPDSVCPPGTIECGHDSAGTPFCHSTSVGNVVCCPREGDGGYVCVNAVCCGGSCCGAGSTCQGDVCCPNGWQLCGGIRCCPKGCCGEQCCDPATQLCCNGACTNGTACPS